METISANDFWDWFSANSNKYYFLNDTDDETKEELMDSLLEKLHDYSTGLYFLVGGSPNEQQELIITAEGNLAYFDDVTNLVNVAPKLEHWNVIAFVPAQGFEFKTQYKTVELDPYKLWFLPLKNNEDAEKLGIRIGVSQVIPDAEQADFLTAAYIVLDTILGEQKAAEDIDYLDIQRLPANFDELGYHELTSLAAYIDWFKS